MVDLKLARIPDRTPVKLTITVLPDLHQALQDYARIYAETYGRDEPVSELVPAILSASSIAIAPLQRRASALEHAARDGTRSQRRPQRCADRSGACRGARAGNRKDQTV